MRPRRSTGGLAIAEPPSLGESRVALGAAPALLVYRGTVEAAARTGAVLCYHGLSASKEANRPELRSLASRGYLAVGLDNAGHGERRYADFERRFSGERSADELLGAVRETAREVPAVLDVLVARHGVDPRRVGIAGISMGGFVVYSALLEDPRIQVATPILGSPRWWNGSPDSPHRHAERFFPRAILSQNAGADESVPPVAARDFHQRLAAMYASAPERQRYVEFAGAQHFMPEHDWQVLWRNVLDWFDRFLRSGPALPDR